MLSLRDRVAVTMPRMAVVVHDLGMVWLCWLALHQFRYALQPSNGVPGVGFAEVQAKAA